MIAREFEDVFLISIQLNPITANYYYLMFAFSGAVATIRAEPHKHCLWKRKILKRPNSQKAWSCLHCLSTFCTNLHSISNCWARKRPAEFWELYSQCLWYAGLLFSSWTFLWSCVAMLACHLRLLEIWRFGWVTLLQVSIPSSTPSLIKSLGKALVGYSSVELICWSMTPRIFLTATRISFKIIFQ